MYRERSNGRDYFILEIEEGQELDTIAIRMMEENSMQGIMPFRKVNGMDGSYFEYEIRGQETLQDWLVTSHSKSEVISLLNSLIQIEEEAEVNLLETDHLGTEQEFVMIADSKCCLPYIPYVDYSNGGLMELVKEIVYGVNVLQNENFNYIYDIRNAISSEEITGLEDLKKWLNKIQGQEDVKRGEMPHTDYSQNPQMPNPGQIPPGMYQGGNGAQNPIYPEVGNWQENNNKKKEEKAPKKPFWEKKEKEVKPVPPVPANNAAALSPFDEYFGGMPGNQPTAGKGQNVVAPPPVKEEKAPKKAASKFSLSSLGGKKKKTMPPQGGRQGMPPQGGRPGVPPQGGMPGMPSQGGMPGMPPQGGMPGMPPQPEAAPMSGGYIINELEYDNDGTVLISKNGSGNNNCKGYIKCKDYPNGFLLERDRYVIGISQKADIRITGNGTVSRSHAIIYRQAGEFYIEDDNSSNGTYVNNRQLMAHTPCKLENGAKIQLSNENIIFEVG